MSARSWTGCGACLSKNDGWKPREGTVKPDNGQGCDGWIFTKDDRKRTPRGTLRPEGRNTTSERDQVWLSMFSAMKSAMPPRCVLLGERGQRGLKVLIPRYAVYPE